jgi:hypothetical protein
MISPVSVSRTVANPLSGSLPPVVAKPRVAGAENSRIRGRKILGMVASFSERAEAREWLRFPKNAMAPSGMRPETGSRPFEKPF